MFVIIPQDLKENMKQQGIMHHNKYFCFLLAGNCLLLCG